MAATAAGRVVERKLQDELRQRLGAAGYQVLRFYRIYAPDGGGVVEVLFRGYAFSGPPARVDVFTALIADDEVAVCRGW